jgi:hypothetical protein
VLLEFQAMKRVCESFALRHSKPDKAVTSLRLADPLRAEMLGQGEPGGDSTRDIGYNPPL